jgi:hypothetical protein
MCIKIRYFVKRGNLLIYNILLPFFASAEKGSGDEYVLLIFKTGHPFIEPLFILLYI